MACTFQQLRDCSFCARKYSSFRDLVVRRIGPNKEIRSPHTVDVATDKGELERFHDADAILSGRAWQAKWGNESGYIFVVGQIVSVQLHHGITVRPSQ